MFFSITSLDRSILRRRSFLRVCKRFNWAVGVRSAFRNSPSLISVYSASLSIFPISKLAAGQRFASKSFSQKWLLACASGISHQLTVSHGDSCGWMRTRRSKRHANRPTSQPTSAQRHYPCTICHSTPEANLQHILTENRYQGQPIGFIAASEPMTLSEVGFGWAFCGIGRSKSLVISLSLARWFHGEKCAEK